MKKTRLCELLGIEYPIIQAPMSWGTCAELVAAVSNAGGMGVFGPNAGYRTVTTDVVETGERLRRQIKKVRALTAKPFGVNIVVDPPGTPEIIVKFSEQTLKVAIEERVPVAVLTGHVPAFTEQLKDAGIKAIFRASPVSIEVAKKAEQMGVDAFIAVGFEGGGHVGTDRTPVFMLLPQIVDAIRIPVVAGGGISDSRQLVAILVLGAEGVYMGTRFIASTECPAHPRVKQAICDADYTSTVTCTGLIGVLRALKTPLMERCIEIEAKGATPAEITEFYSGGFREGLLEGDMNNGVISFGMGAGIIKETKSAGDIVRDIIREAERVTAGLA
jgi:enoyl-[acyl-carrier protein] reductase II